MGDIRNRKTFNPEEIAVRKGAQWLLICHQKLIIYGARPNEASDLICTQFISTNYLNAIKRVDGALQDISGGHFVDDIGAFGTAGIGFQEGALHGGGGQSLVP
jgi:hypothetical protein